jgi:thiol-disulfide isomerase/thioredoxin
MHRIKLFFLLLLLGTAPTIICCKTASCDNSVVNLKQVSDGLVAIVSNSQSSLDNIRFECNQENNSIIIDLPADGDAPAIDNLLRNPLVTRNGASLLLLSKEKLQRISIIPKLKLYCTGMRQVNKFQRYVTYFYPAGHEFKLQAAEVRGFNFDENNPRPQVTGSINLTFNEPLGNVDLSDVIKTSENRLTLRLNPKDFINQELLTTVFPAKNLQVTKASDDSPGEHNFTFKAISNAEISKISAKVVKSATSNEVRIDLTLGVSLYDTGKNFYETGDTRKALLYMTAAKSEPALALIARMSIGTIYWNEDNHAEASKVFKELIELDRRWEFPEARYYSAKASYLTNKRLTFEQSGMLKEYLRRCDRTNYSTCSDARELSEQVNEPALKISIASKADLKRLVARLSDPKQNYNEVQKNIFHYWATWCPLCLEEMPKIMQYAVSHPNIDIHIVAKHDQQKTIFNTLLKAGAIRRKNIFYYIDTKDDIMLRQMVPLILANKEPVTPLPISVFLQREVPFYLTDKLNWQEAEIARIWQLKYHE